MHQMLLSAWGCVQETHDYVASFFALQWQACFKSMLSTGILLL
jgi:hypothetical protein